MNNQNPLVPQGSLLEQKNKSRARVRLAVFCVLSIHVIGLMALLMQGCRQHDEAALPPVDTNAVTTAMQPVLDTNPPPPVVTAPPTSTPPPVVAQPTAQTYTVAAGDTYSSIAKKFPGVTVKAIQDANPGVEPTRIRPGQVLHIPPPAAPAPTMTATATTSAQTGTADGEQMYTVQSGDNLTKIAERFKTSVRAIRAANPNLTTDRITVGQKLKIPAHTTPPPPMATPAPAGSLHPTA